MMILEILVVVLGLCVFEIISSVDNAIINAHVLKTMPEKFRKIFLFWGIVFAVFVVRGLLPFVIVWLTNPSLNIIEVFSSSFSSDNGMVKESLDASKPLLLLGGGFVPVPGFFSLAFPGRKEVRFLG
jgi:uncharacterized protein